MNKLLGRRVSFLTTLTLVFGINDTRCLLILSFFLTRKLLFQPPPIKFLEITPIRNMVSPGHTPIPSTFLLFSSWASSYNTRNEAQSCYEVAKYFWNRGSRLVSFFLTIFKCMENKQKFEKLTKVNKNFYLEAQKLLRIYDLRLDSC